MRNMTEEVHGNRIASRSSVKPSFQMACGRNWLIQLGISYADLCLNLDFIEKAAQDEKKGNDESAVEKYAAGLACFETYMKHERRKEVRQLIKDIFIEYLEHAEKVKSLFNQKKSQGTPTATTGTSSQNQVVITTRNNQTEHPLLSLAETKTLNVKLDDCVGLEQQDEELLLDYVVVPSKCPQLFQGKIRPLVEILLSGPPSVRKTLLAHAIATETGASLFVYSISEIKSAWYCGHRTLLSEVFGKARGQTRTVVLFREIHELELILTADRNSRNFTDKFFKELEMVRESRNSSVVVIVETSHPEKMDPVLKHQFSARIHIPVPDASA